MKELTEQLKRIADVLERQMNQIENPEEHLNYVDARFKSLHSEIATLRIEIDEMRDKNDLY